MPEEKVTPTEMYVVSDYADMVRLRSVKNIEKANKDQRQYGRPELTTFQTEVEAAEFIVQRARERVDKAEVAISRAERECRNDENRLKKALRNLRSLRGPSNG